MAATLNYGTYYSGQTNQSASNLRKLLIIGLIVAMVIGLVLFILTLLSSNNKNDITLLVVRENSLLQLATASQKTIKAPELSTANSNATILLASDVTGLMSASGIKKLPDDLVKQEADTNGDKLKQANLLAKFDLIYRQVVLDKLSGLISEAEAVKNSASSKKMQAAAAQALINLQSINQQFTQLSL